uniref:5-oxoprolinase subunit C family protein n=1 Tax=Oceanithermus sp. TaxID=2268145 RepID=UPI0025D82C09
TALELNLVGPLLEALEEVTVALAGIGPGYDGNWGRTVTLRKGETLDLRRPGPGARSYLALPGGFALERFMGSASPDLKGRIGRPLAAGDVLRQEASTQARRLARTWSPVPLEPREGPVRLRILPGPQADAEALASLTTATFRVGHADRMGLRLEGASVPGGEVTSEGVPLGAVQVPPGGAPMLLLADRGTIGGYAKPAVLHPADLPRAGQLKEGDRVRFVLAKNALAYCTVAL